MDAVIENIRLDQVMYMNLRNDISFLVDNKLIVLAEHQSTINENMPLRFLEYIGRLYERTQEPKNKYLRGLVKIPTPEFFVFYNGKEDYPTEKTLKLSDAFLTETKNSSLELTVKVFNINKNKNNRILKKCKELEEYSTLIETVRKYNELDYENGFEKAIKECLSNGILKGYLERKTREVQNMLVGEYDYAMDIAVQSQEAAEKAAKKAAEIVAKKAEIEAIEKTIRTARILKTMGLSLDKISEATELPLAEIEKL